MEAKEFEKLQKAMLDMDAPVSPDLWERVESSAFTQKKKILPWYWAAAAVAVLGLGLTFLIMNRTGETQPRLTEQQESGDSKLPMEEPVNQEIEKQEPENLAAIGDRKPEPWKEVKETPQELQKKETIHPINQKEEQNQAPAMEKKLASEAGQLEKLLAEERQPEQTTGTRVTIKLVLDESANEDALALQDLETGDEDPEGPLPNLKRLERRLKRDYSLKSMKTRVRTMFAASEPAKQDSTEVK